MKMERVELVILCIQITGFSCFIHVEKRNWLSDFHLERFGDCGCLDRENKVFNFVHVTQKHTAGMVTIEELKKRGRELLTLEQKKELSKVKQRSYPCGFGYHNSWGVLCYMLSLTVSIHRINISSHLWELTAWNWQRNNYTTGCYHIVFLSVFLRSILENIE